MRVAERIQLDRSKRQADGVRHLGGRRHRDPVAHECRCKLVGTNLFWQGEPDEVRRRMADTSQPGEDIGGNRLPDGRVPALLRLEAGDRAVATSTGGMTNKRVGRIGDSPLIGSGTYADGRTAAVSCTSSGEMFIRVAAAYDVCARMAYGGATLEAATHAVVQQSLPAIGGTGGLIAVDRHGNLSLAFNTEGMYRGPRPWRRSAGHGHLRLKHTPPFLPRIAMSSPALNLPDGRVLAVDDLTVRFSTSERTVDAVKNLSFHVDHGETLAVVGESGSGKSVTSLALMRLVEHGGSRILGGRMAFRRRNSEVLDLAQARDTTMRGIRGAGIAMIFQEPMTSLNPVFTAGEQIAEAIRIHQGKNNTAARAEALRMLELVRIPEARNVLDRFPHQLSGGMRQRVMIAMALSCKPQLLIADEPTTALDVTIQAQIVNLMLDLQRELGVAFLFISHDMAVVERISHRVAVMYLGQIVEIGPRRAVFEAPQHAYTPTPAS